MTTAAIVRQALKTELSLTSRQVSVRQSSGSVHVTIKSAGISTEKVKEAAERYQKIHRDEAHGGILRGANTFVWVHLDRSLFADLSAEILPWVESLPQEQSKIYPTPMAKDLGVSRSYGNPYMYNLWDLSSTAGSQMETGASGIADAIAAHVVENS